MNLKQTKRAETGSLFIYKFSDIAANLGGYFFYPWDFTTV